MFIKKLKPLALTASIAALQCLSAQAAITIVVSPALANVAADLVSDFISVTNDIVDPTGKTGLGYAVSSQIMPDADAEAAIIAAAASGTGPDLFLSQSSKLTNDLLGYPAN